MDLRIFIILCSFLVNKIRCDPQLDIPNVQPSEEPRQRGLKVLVLPNSYTNDKFDNQPKSDANNYPYDSDRSQRYGNNLNEINLLS